MDWLIILIVAAFLLLWLARRNARLRGTRVASVKRVEQTRQSMRGSFAVGAMEGSRNVIPLRPGRSAARWIPAGESVTIAGIRFDGGMVYVGSVLEAPNSGRRPDNCLIDPALKVTDWVPDRIGSTMPYFPSYSDIQPQARHAYLDWLAGGRRDPGVGIGYVFLFFYGLERRVMIDGADLDLVEGEVRRLLTIYGSNGSFRGYADRLVNVMAALRGPQGKAPPLSSDMRIGGEFPLAVRIHLGRLLMERRRIEADDGLRWVLSSPETTLKVPATRCFDELVALWRHRFDERFPGGMFVRAPKQVLVVGYRPASGTFSRQIEVSIGGAGVPDITSLSAGLARFRELLDACTEELAPYSRLIGRKPQAKGTMEAAVLLPAPLARLDGNVGLGGVVSRLGGLIGDRPLVALRSEDLLRLLQIDTPDNGKINAAIHNRIGTYLDRIDIGYEPDRRYGPAGLGIDGGVVLFRAEDGGAVDGDASAYKATRTVIDVAAMAAVSDGAAAEDEFSAIKAEIRAVPGLSSVERTRLTAYATILMKDTTRRQVALGRLSKLPEVEKRRAAASAVSTVLADGHASPTEVKFLERLYKAFGYAGEDLYAALHRGGIEIGAASDDPVVVSDASPSVGRPIPAPPIPARGQGIEIDLARLARVKAETAAVSGLLADIFVEEAPPEQPKASIAAERGIPSFEGLDAPHGRLLSMLLAVGSTTRSAYDEHARELRLLPDGAMETINEWAFEAFDEPVLEGDEDIVVVEHLMKRLRELERAE